MKDKWDMAKDQVEAAASEAASDQERCTRQYVQTVARNAKCHSSQQKESLSTAGTATRNTKSSDCKLFFYIFLIFYCYFALETRYANAANIFNRITHFCCHAKDNHAC